MFKKLKSAISGGRDDVVRQDLGRLNQHQKGLGDKAVSYVNTGLGGEVLSTLSNSQIPNELLFGYHFDDTKTSISDSRRQFFLDTAPYDTALMARYGQVLHASRASAAQFTYGMAGPDKANPVLRVFFGQAFEATIDSINRFPRQARDAPVTGMTPENAIEIGKHLDADPADILAIILWKGNYWEKIAGEWYADLADLKSYFQSNPDTVVAADKQLNAESRAELAERIGKWGLANQQPFLDLLMSHAGGSAKTAREAAVNTLLAVPAETLEPLATQILANGTVAAREGMVVLLSKLGTPTATATLQDHLKTEKAARIRSAIENMLLVSADETEDNAAETEADGQTGYVALDGTRVDIPQLRTLPDDPAMQLSKDVRSRIEEAIQAYNAAATKTNAELDRKKQKWGRQDLIKNPARSASVIWTMFNTGKVPNSGGPEGNLYHTLQFRMVPLFNELTAQIPLKRQVMLSIAILDQEHLSLQHFLSYTLPQPVRSWLETPQGDLRAVEKLLQDQKVRVRLGGWQKPVTRVLQAGDMLYDMMPDYDWGMSWMTELDPDAIWPIVAQNLSILDETFGLKTSTGPEVAKHRGVFVLQQLPKTPKRYFGALLDIATGETKAGRAEARALLTGAEGVDERLMALLSDSRQAIRAGSAEWLADRGCKDAVKPLKTRLKKEKSELARAAILTALKDLGEDLSSFVGPTALIREAEAGLKKAKLDKLNWLGLDHLPALAWKNGKTAPADVGRWWLFLANKLKQPGGNALFEIYLDQLDPQSAEGFSAWIFDSWVTYDIQQRTEAEGIAHAKAHVKSSFQSWSIWDKNITEDAVFQILKREITSQYLNSGAASKGVLALATHVPASHAAARVKQYLRNHGGRTSQATALLEMLAAKGDPISLQVVIGAATRLKQKGTQAKAAEMVEAVADARGWSLSELADRTIPTGGLDDEGVLELPCGPEEKLYQARLSDDLTLILTNPDGKDIKGLPAGDDEATKAAKKQLSTSKKEIKQVIKAQADRLYEALCAERIWPVSDWYRDFQDHPIMRRLTPRVVWLGLDEQGTPMKAFRPTEEGDLTDVEDNPVTLSDFAALRLAHGALLGDASAAVWQAHLKDYEVTPLFSQFGRPLLRVQDKDAKADEITDRQGWLTEAFSIRGAANKLGYDRGEALDGGFFCHYIKPFRSADLTAVIEFSGNGLPEENVAAVLKTLSFTRRYSGYGGRNVPLEDVPPVLLSECWNDYHEMAAKAEFDPEWETKMPW